MAKKTRKFQWKWHDFWLQSAAIILGVVVTFAGSDLITRWQQQRQIKTMMQLVVEELQTNLTAVDKVKSRIDEDRRGMQLFARYNQDVEAIPVDSLEHCGLQMGAAQYYKTQTDALEVLKSSGLLSSIGDKRFVMNILRCYSYLTALDEMSASYFDLKKSAVNHLLANPPQLHLPKADPRATWKQIMADPVCAGFISSCTYYFGQGDTNVVEQSYAGTARMIEQIDKKYDFK